MTISALYAGAVTHQRLAPRRHRLRYRMFQLLIDLGELDRLRGLRWLGIDRPGPLSFRQRDHGAGGADLRGWADGVLARGGIELGPGGRVQVLSMPRVLGFVFNPLSVYFCRRAGGALAATLYEVNNTFGQRHTYLIPAGAAGSCAKTFHVSPFMDLAMSYDFGLAVTDTTLTTAVLGRGSNGAPLISAVFRGERRPLSDAALARAFLAFPLLTAKVVLAIHWEAVKLLLKGLRLQPRPADPPGPVTIAPNSEAVAPVGQHAEPQRLAGDVAGLAGGHEAQARDAPAAQVLVREQA